MTLTKHLTEREEHLARIDSGITPLHQAIYMQEVEVIKILMNAGANPHIKSERNDHVFEGLTALQFAEKMGTTYPDVYGETLKLVKQLTNSKK